MTPESGRSGPEPTMCDSLGHALWDASDGENFINVALCLRCGTVHKLPSDGMLCAAEPFGPFVVGPAGPVSGWRAFE